MAQQRSWELTRTHREKLYLTFFVYRAGNFFQLILKSFTCKYIYSVSRMHDFRLELGLQETVWKNDTHFTIIQEMVRMVSAAVPGELTLVPCTNNWTVEFIRHKRRSSYILAPDNMHMVTVSHITEHEVKCGACQAGDQLPISLNGSENNHWEVEVYISFISQMCMLLHLDRSEVMVDK